MGDVKRTLVNSFTVAAVLGAAIGIQLAIHSSLFLVQVVEIADQPKNSPVDAQTITQLAAVPTGIVNLFDLDLKAVEKRILSNHWIHEVRLQKRFPQTLSVAVTFREPKAIFQWSDGTLAYVDSEGRPFGRINLQLNTELPILSGFSDELENNEKLINALNILHLWEKSALPSTAQLSTLSWHPQIGYRALISYSLGAVGSHARATVDLGQEVDAQMGGQFGRLSEVVHYLTAHSISVRQIFADVGKKIVVKTSRGS